MRDRSETSTIPLDVDAVVQVFEGAPVRRGVLFGSFARREERTESDVDVAVEFDRSLSSVEQTKARLDLIERLSAALGLDEVDVIPLSRAPADLRREINRDGIALYGPSEPLDVHDEGDGTHEDRIEQFDDILADLERVV